MGGFKDQLLKDQERGRRGAIINQQRAGTPAQVSTPKSGVKFDGNNVTQADKDRLSPQLQKLWDLMKDKRWRTLGQISSATNIPEASASARLRDFRKPRNGGHTVNAEHVGNGLWQYQLIPALPPGQGELF